MHLLKQSQPDTEIPAATRPAKSVSWRSLLIGTLLVPLNAYWLIQMESIRYSAHPTTISILFNAIFIILVLGVLNMFVARRRPSWALTQGELMVIYIMVMISSAVVGHDMVQVLVPMLAWPFQFPNHASPMFVDRLPKWLMVSDPDVIRGYFYGNSTLYDPAVLAAWAKPILMWGLFIIAILFVVQCINTILRKQWTEHEKLAYPVAQVPLEVTDGTAEGRAPRIFRNKLFWIAFIFAGSMDIINGLNLYYPSIPRILVPGNGLGFFDIGPLVTAKPWNAIGWTPISWYPFIIGFGMLLPVDLLFSCWFFYIFWKMQTVAAVTMAYDIDPRIPYVSNQAFGAYVAFFIFSMWLSRKYLADVWRCAVGAKSALDDSEEPIRYRWALLGIATGTTFLCWFCTLLGLSWSLGLLFMGIYFVLSVAITRMRAELGSPVHDLHFTGPDYILPDVLGQRAFGADTLVGFSILYWFNRAYRCHPMPMQLEGFKLAEKTRSSQRAWFWGMLFAGVIATAAAFWAMLHLNYQYGAVAKAQHRFGWESYNRLAGWLVDPKGPNGLATAAVFVGLGMAFLLQFLRTRLPWWPFHPLGFAVASGWEMNLVWMPLFIAWLLKVIILRYGGLKGFRNSLPFFYGLILGQFVVGSLLNILGVLLKVPTYQFWQ